MKCGLGLETIICLKKTATHVLFDSKEFTQWKIHSVNVVITNVELVCHEIHRYANNQASNQNISRTPSVLIHHEYE